MTTTIEDIIAPAVSRADRTATVIGYDSTEGHTYVHVRRITLRDNRLDKATLCGKLRRNGWIVDPDEVRATGNMVRKAPTCPECQQRWADLHAPDRLAAAGAAMIPTEAPAPKPAESPAWAVVFIRLPDGSTLSHEFLESEHCPDPLAAANEAMAAVQAEDPAIRTSIARDTRASMLSARTRELATFDYDFQAAVARASGAP